MAPMHHLGTRGQVKVKHTPVANQRMAFVIERYSILANLYYN